MFFHDEFVGLDALNIGKVCTGAIILLLAGKYGFDNPNNNTNGGISNTIVYTGMHLSYLSWWFLEQFLFPPFWEKRFGAPMEPIGAIVIISVFGIIYALPAYNAFTKPTTLSPATAIACIIMFTLGCLVNAMADVQMHAMKLAHPDTKVLVTEGIFRLAQNPNWFGDYLRYAAFAVSSGGHWSSFVPLMLGILTNVFSTQDPLTKGGLRDRYGADVYDEWIANVPNKIIPAVPTEVAVVMGTLGLIWVISLSAGYFSGLSSAGKKKTA